MSRDDGKTARDLVTIPVDAVTESGAVRVRKFYNKERLSELANSLASVGTLQPIVVRQKDNGKSYELIIGSRRLRATRLRKMHDIPALILSGVDDRQALIMGLGENLHRENLTPFEEAWAILALTREHGMTVKDVASAIDREERFVRVRLQLLSLPPEVQEFVGKGRLQLGHLELLQRIPDDAKKVRIARVIVNERLAPRDAAMLTDEDRTVRKQRNVERFSGRKIILRIRDFTRFLEEAGKQFPRLSESEKVDYIQAIGALHDVTRVIVKK